MELDRPNTFLSALAALGSVIYRLLYGVTRVVLFVLTIFVELLGAIAS